MQFFGQTEAQSPQAVQSLASMTACLSLKLRAGQPSSLMHFLQPTQRSLSTFKVAFRFYSAMQGERKMMARTPFSSAASFTAAMASS